MLFSIFTIGYYFIVVTGWWAVDIPLQRGQRNRESDIAAAHGVRGRYYSLVPARLFTSPEDPAGKGAHHKVLPAAYRRRMRPFHEQHVSFYEPLLKLHFTIFDGYHFVKV